MKISALWIVAVAVTFSHSSLAATGDDAKCALPDHLQREVAQRYPGSHIVAISDLGNDDKALFAKEHGDACPGVSRVDFYGNGQPTLAISLVSNSEKKAILIAAHQVSDSWIVTQIDTADSAIPVVWNDNPGEYTDVYGKKKIHAARPVIVWCAYESWAILYAWTGSRVSKIWISD